MKINVDSGRRDSEGGWSLAAVAQDSRGECVGVQAVLIRQPIEVVVAELLAMGLGLDLGDDLDGRPFVVEYDCSQAVSLVNGEEEQCKDVDSIVENLKWKRTTTNCMGI